MPQLFLLDERNHPIAEGYQPYRAPSNGGIGGFLMSLFLLMFPVLGLFFVITMVGSTIRDIQQKQALQQSGQRVQASVLFTNTESDDDSTSYYLTYQYLYTPRNGDPVPYSNRESVSREVYEKTKQGERVEVIYLPADPKVVRLIGNHRIEPLWIALSGLFLLVWSSLFCGVPIAILVGAAQTAKRRKRMGTGGQLLQGQVTFWSGDVDSDGDYMIKLKYEFHDPFGRLVEDKVSGQYNSLKGKLQPHPGTPVAIWYLDEKAYEVL